MVALEEVTPGANRQMDCLYNAIIIVLLHSPRRWETFAAKYESHITQGIGCILFGDTWLSFGTHDMMHM